MALSMFGKTSQDLGNPLPSLRPFQRYLGRDEVIKRATQPIAPTLRPMPVNSGFSQVPLNPAIPQTGGIAGGISPQPQVAPQVQPQVGFQGNTQLSTPAPIQPTLAGGAASAINPAIPGTTASPATQLAKRTMAPAQKVPTVGTRPSVLSLANRNF